MPRGQRLNRDIVLSLIGDVDAAHNGIVLGENGVRQVRCNRAVVIIQMDYQCRNILLVAHGCRQPRKPGLALHDVVGVILQI